MQVKSLTAYQYGKTGKAVYFVGVFFDNREMIITKERFTKQGVTDS